MHAIRTDVDLTYARYLKELAREWALGWRRGFAEGFIAAAAIAGLWIALAR